MGKKRKFLLSYLALIALVISIVSPKNQVFASENARALPVKYDSRDKGYVTSVRDQGEIGACWSFAGMGALETTAKKVHGKTEDFSEINGAANNGIVDANQGGNDYVTASYLSSWKGPVAEVDDKYPNPPKPSNINSNKNAKARYHIQDMIIESDLSVNEIKNMVYTHGSATTGVASRFIDLKTGATYNDRGSWYTDHEVLIVGWDDNYKKENFKSVSGRMPSNNGAFICKNSWGTGVGNKGYIYISYEDDSLKKSTHSTFPRLESTNNYSGMSEGIFNSNFNENFRYWTGNGYIYVYQFNKLPAAGKGISALGAFIPYGKGEAKVRFVNNYKEADLVKYINDNSNIVKTENITSHGFKTIKLGKEIKPTNSNNYAFIVHVPHGVESYNSESNTEKLEKVEKNLIPENIINSKAKYSSKEAKSGVAVFAGRVYSPAYSVPTPPASGAKIGSFVTDKASGTVKVGETVKLNSYATGTNIRYEYMVKYNNQWTTISKYSSTKLVNWIPRNAGEYTLRLKVKNANSTKGYDDYKDIKFIVKGTTPTVSGAKIGSFVTDKASGTVKVGETVKLNSYATGTNVRYEYMVKYNNQWTTISKYSSTKLVNWIPRNAGEYTLRLKVKNANSTKGYDDYKDIKFVVVNGAKIGSFVTDKASGTVKVGETVKLNSYATGTNVRYEYMVKYNNQWTTISKYSSTKLVNWIPRNAGEYTLRLKVKNANSTKGYDDYKDIKFTVKAYKILSDYTMRVSDEDISKIEFKNINSSKEYNNTKQNKIKVENLASTISGAKIGSFVTDKTSGTVKAGETVKLNSYATGTNVRYEYMVKYNNQWTTISKYSSTKLVNWIPRNAGEYTLRLKVKNANSTKGYDDYKDIKFIVKATTPTVSGAKIGSFVTDKTSGAVKVGETVKLNSYATGTNVRYEYMVKYNNQWTTISTYSSTKLINWIPKNAGEYTLRLKVKNANSTKGYDDYKDIKFIVKATTPTVSGAKIGSFVTDKTSGTVTVGETVRLNSYATGTNVRYEYMVKYNNQWTTISKYSSTKLVNWAPKNAGEYTLRLKVKNASSTKGYDDYKDIKYIVKAPQTNSAKIISFTTDKASGTVEKWDRITLKTVATGTNVRYEYYAKHEDDDKWSKISSDSNLNTVNWSGSDSGLWKLKVTVKDANSAKEYDDFREISFRVKPLQMDLPIMKNIETNVPSGLAEAGDEVEVCANSTGVYDLRYKFYVKYENGPWEMVRDYSSSNYLYWIPKKAGNYTIRAMVKHKDSMTAYDSFYDLPFKVIEPIADARIKTFRADTSLSSIKEYDEVKFSAYSPGSVAYEYLVKDPSGKWTVVRNYSSTSHMYYQFKKSGTYIIRVRVKNIDSNKVYDDYKDIKIVVNPLENAKITSVNIDKPSGTVKPGDSIFIYTGATGDYVRWEFSIKLGDGQWKVVRGYDIFSSYTWKPTEAGTYTIRIRVKNSQDATGYDDEKIISYIVK